MKVPWLNIEIFNLVSKGLDWPCELPVADDVTSFLSPHPDNTVPTPTIAVRIANVIALRCIMTSPLLLYYHGFPVTTQVGISFNL